MLTRCAIQRATPDRRSSFFRLLTGYDTHRDAVRGHRAGQILVVDIPWQSAFLSEEFISASHCFDQAARLRESIAGHIHIFDFHFYSALSLTVPLIAEQYTPDVQNKVVHHYQQIAGWANENPGTFSDKEALLSAEICRLEGKSLPAMEKYETAIRLSQEGGFIHINALCHELAGNFAHYAGLNVAADAYFKKAINAWREWGQRLR